MVKAKRNKGERTCGEIIAKVRTCVRRMSVCGKKEFEVRKIDRNKQISDKFVKEWESKLMLSKALHYSIG